MTEAVPYAGRRPEDLSADELGELLRFHDTAYFDHAKPVITDAQYDQLVALLRAKAPDHPQLHRVGATPSSVAAGDKVVHERPMLSLDKCTSPPEFIKWLESIWYLVSGEVPISTRHGDPARREQKIRERSAQKERFAVWMDTSEIAELVALPKVDGLACTIRYSDDGRMVLAATRGDGDIGENVTETVRRVGGVPGEVQHARGIEVRGEVYMPLEEFAKVSEQFSNPRNLAAGVLKAKEHTTAVPEMLRFAAYDILGELVETESDKFALLAQLGFEVTEFALCRGQSASEIFEEFSEDAIDWPFEADGVVFRLNSCHWARYLGTTAHHPIAAMAWKFAVGRGTSTLVAIEWSVGRTGTITPLAIVEPVLLSGALVARATLHNISRFKAMSLGLGDQLELARRGGVIPHVERVLKHSDQIRLDVPTSCPACGGQVAQEMTVRNGGTTSILLACREKAKCPGVKARAVLHFCKTLEMDGFGEATLLALSKAGRLDDPSGLYELTPEFLTSLDGFAEVGAANLLRQVAAAKRVTLVKFLTALGIPRLGAQTAAILAEGRDLTAIRQLDPETLCPRISPTVKARRSTVRGIGYTTAQKIASGFREAADTIDRLLLHVTVVPPVAKKVDGVLAGETVVFTGALAVMKRAHAQKWVVDRGGVPGSDVTAETTLLVVGGDELEAAVPSSKLKKARKLQQAGGTIEILSEAEFFSRFGAA